MTKIDQQEFSQISLEEKKKLATKKWTNTFPNKKKIKRKHK